MGLLPDEILDLNEILWEDGVSREVAKIKCLILPVYTVSKFVLDTINDTTI